MKIKAVLLGLAFLCAMSVRPASAAFFDDSDGKWWMAADQWNDFTDLDPTDAMTIKDNNDRLEFSADSAKFSTSVNPIRGINTKWRLDKNYDFDISLNYRNAVEACSFVGLTIGGDNGSTYYHMIVDARSGINGVDPMALGFEMDQVAGGFDRQYYQRLEAEGLFNVHYDAALDEMIFFGTDGTADGKTYIIEDVVQTYGMEDFHITLIAGASGSFTGSDVFLKNFSLNEGVFTADTVPVVTPEPASMVLFGLGGAAMAFARRRKR